MSPGPLRRLMGMLGLLALAPTALMLALDQIAPMDAAVRGSATLVASTVVGRTAGWWVAMIARGLDRRGRQEDAPGGTPAVGSPAVGNPGRRRDDGAPAAATG